MAEKINLIVVMCDTFRRDHLGCYGSPDGRTPNLDRLAQQSVVFDNAHACSFPTLPCRVELFTGKFVFPSVRWGPFPSGEVTLAERLAGARYETAAILDNLPFCRNAYGYDRGFDTRVRIRGQWYDEWADTTADLPLPVAEHKLGEPARVKQYLRNVAGRKREADYFAPQVMSSAVDWLERFGQRNPFFLYVDCFDPHEPWDPPEGDYDPEIVGENRIIYPNMGRATQYSDEEIAAIRELYGGEVRMVDRQIGRLLDAVDRLGLRDRTAVVFMSDHGVFLGEHNLIGKSGKRELDVNGWPPYREVSEIPLMVRLPGAAPKRVPAFVHPGDVMPTLLDLAGVPVPPDVTASSLLPLIHGEKEWVRDIGVTAWSYRGWRSHHPTCIRNDEWSMIWWRTGIPPRLHHLPTDPGEVHDVFPKHSTIARDLHARYVEFLKRQPCRLKNYWSRRFFLIWSSPAQLPRSGHPPAVPAPADV